jgi:hypothetical protein
MVLGGVNLPSEVLFTRDWHRDLDHLFNDLFNNLLNRNWHFHVTDLLHCVVDDLRDWNGDIIGN